MEVPQTLLSSSSLRLPSARPESLLRALYFRIASSNTKHAALARHRLVLYPGSSPLTLYLSHGVLVAFLGTSTGRNWPP
jgi:hypothetical protein